MAKASKSTESKKIIFGVRRKGKHSKSVGPKATKYKKSYKGQGR